MRDILDGHEIGGVQCPGCGRTAPPGLPPGPHGAFHYCGGCGQTWGHVRWPAPPLPEAVARFLAERAIPLD